MSQLIILTFFVTYSKPCLSCYLHLVVLLVTVAITLTNVSVLPLQVRVRKHGDAKKYNAYVIHVGHECDIAMVTICCVNLYICV